jgi:UDP-3-O-[3-hydroxymyristoyl] glucosamine N-acyltransferase
MKLRDLAAHLGATLRGDGDTEITGTTGIEQAGAADLTFVSNPKYAGAARTTAAGAVVVAPDFPEISAPTLRLSNPYLAFSQAIALFHPAPVYAPGIHPTAVIDPSAEIAAGAHIGAYVVVGAGVRLGPSAVLLPHVVLYPGVQAGRDLLAHAHSVVREGCILGDRVILGNGVVVGGDGYGFAKRDDGSWQKIPQPGPVRIGNDVEIQANSCIDRASVGETVIADGVKVDNLVQVGHGSSVGENTLLCAQVGLAGSSEIGRNVVLAGQVGIAGHCRIGDGVIITAQSGTSADVPPGKMLSGSPAYDHRLWLRVSSILPRLPEMVRRLPRKTEKEQTPAK